MVKSTRILKGSKGREEAKDLDRVMDSSRRIAREISGSAYIWDSKDSGKTEIASDGNRVEYI